MCMCKKKVGEGMKLNESNEETPGQVDEYGGLAGVTIPDRESLE
jgi:hypothetical protein